MKNLYLIKNIKNTKKECELRTLLPYNLKRTYLLGLLALIGLASCKKGSESEYDKLLKEYTAMQADSANMAKAIKQLTDVELAAPTTQTNLKETFWRKAVITPLPLNFADSVAGKKPDGTINGGYKSAADAIVLQYGPSGTNSMTAESVTLMNEIGTNADTYTSFLPSIASKRQELSLAR
jgi:hypothetical protein